MEPQATDQRLPPPLFSILTLNTNTRTDLAALPTLLRENKPDFVFLQEVNISLEWLRAAVGGLGYSVWLSSADQPKRVIAVLSLHPAAPVTNLIPGYLQKVIFEDLAIFHLHAPSDSVIRNKIIFFQQIWRGRLERLAWPQIVAPTHKGGLGVACIEVRARALLDKQACHRLAAGGWPRAHLSYWIGLPLLHFLPSLRAGPHVENPPLLC